MSEQPILPVILSGGSGTRLWPLSRTDFPKQFLALAGTETMLQATVRRVADPARFLPPLVIGSDAGRFIIAEQIAGLTDPPPRIVLEPRARNTAPALAVAALLAVVADPDVLILSLPADHRIGDEGAFHDALRRARAAAESGYLVTFGITPDQPNSAYGYIRRGAPLSAPADGFAVASFIEKPAAAEAAKLLAEGGHYWNSGILLARADRLIEELARFAPAVLKAADQAIAAGAMDLGFFRLGGAFADAPDLAIDRAVLERTDRAAVVPVAMGWADLGSWEALWRDSDRDSAGNALSGPVVAVAGSGSYIRSEGPLVATLGLDDLVVVATRDAVLAAPRHRAAELGPLVQRLKQEGRPELTEPAIVHRPWGSFQILDTGARFRVKRLIVKPGGRLSLQSHRQRAEHWVVVAGTARVIRGDEEFRLEANQSTFIPLGTKHRLENPGPVPLEVIEVQSGAYLGEDDITRFDDAYARAGN